MTDKYSELKQKALTTLNLMAGAINNGGKNFMDIHEEFAERVVYDSKEYVAELEQKIREEERENIIKMIKDRPVQQGWQDRLVEIFGKSIL